MEDAIWLLEFVSKTKGAEHLKLSSRHLNLIQYFCLDIILLWLILVVALWKCFVHLWRRFVSGQSKRKNKSKRE